MIRIGIVGTGFGSLVHVPGFQQIEDAKIVGIASRDPARARSVAQEKGIERAFDSWRELIDSHEIDAVSIALPSTVHAEVVLAAIAKGKAVLCEKPLAADASEAKQLLDAAREAGVVHMVDFEFPEFPAWQKAKEIIDRGELSALRSVTLEWTSSTWANPKRPWAWQCDRAQGGVMRALGIHVLHYIEWFTGPVLSLTASLSTAITKRPDATGALREVTAEDTARLELRLQNGVPVNVTISNVLQDANGHVLTFHGEKGTLILRNGNQPGSWEEFTLTQVAGEERRTIECPKDPAYPDGRIPAFVRLASRFVDAVKMRNTAVRPSFAEGLRAQVLYDAVIQANQRKKWIDVSAFHA